MTKEKKVTTLSIVEKIVQWLPVLVYGIFNIEEFYSTTKSGITITAVFLIGAVLFFIKDTFKAWITKPSLFKYVCICWVLALMFVCIGDKIFVVSSIILASFVAAIPLDVWKQHLSDKSNEAEVINGLKNLLGK